ncbi:putative UBC5-E2 ubiquitin-conjugating enzyme [Testicularia cyperi]|uniref:E2 ubiquitin-conjugating enzyme n=1 Tax=Testicularia cyperi TaxID=1882483 RepID=A0A317XPC2_9BASI|nr:putative UBC5-E2 ubiquitin-conjugating enzyme [Testicularia cyperi]
MASSKRIGKELADLTTSPVDGITVEPKEDNIYKWTAKLQGPANSPYAGGIFLIDMDFPIEYPFKSPKVRFATRVYHPNIDEGGNLCVGILKSEAWKPSTKAVTILLSILQLLEEPNPDDALVASIAELYNTDRAKFDKTAQEYTKKYASA